MSNPIDYEMLFRYLVPIIGGICFVLGYISSLIHEKIKKNIFYGTSNVSEEVALLFMMAFGFGIFLLTILIIKIIQTKF